MYNNTLFLLTSLDGKISTGVRPEFDFDKDFANDPYLKKGLQQYYDIEKTTDEWSVVSTAIAEKLGVEEDKWPVEYVPVNFVVIGNRLTYNGMQNIADKCKSVLFVMTDRHKYEAFKTATFRKNVTRLFMDVLDPVAMFDYIYKCLDAEAVTIQTGGTLNRLFFAKKCINHIDIVVAPTVVGGENTPSMVSGWNRNDWNEGEALPHLKLVDIVHLKNDYIRMRYDVINEE